MSFSVESVACEGFIDVGGNPAIYDSCGTACDCVGHCSDSPPCCVTLSGCVKPLSSISGVQCVPATGPGGLGKTGLLYFSWVGIPLPPDYNNIWKIDMVIEYLKTGPSGYILGYGLNGDLPPLYGGNPVNWGVCNPSSPSITEVWGRVNLGDIPPDPSQFRAQAYVFDTIITGAPSTMTVTDIFLNLYYMSPPQRLNLRVGGTNRNNGGMIRNSSYSVGSCCQ